MVLNKILPLMLFLGTALPSILAQNQGNRTALESSLQSRYPLTIVGGGFMGTHGENTIRRTGGVVIVVMNGLYGSYDRSKLAFNEIKDGKADVFSGGKDVELGRGERFYVNAIHVGVETVTLGLVSVGAISGGSKTSRAWCSLTFYFPEDTLAQGDPGRIYPVIDQWLVPEGLSSHATQSTPAPSVASSATTPVSAPARAIDLKPGMNRGDIVSAMGTPVQETGFGDHRWLTYPGITIALEQGKLVSVDHNLSSLAQAKISSDPDGADILLDGSFVSSTPAILKLQPGTYKVIVRMSGYADWEREVKILPAAEVTLNAKLSK
jgi:hypothetical protein